MNELTERRLEIKTVGDSKMYVGAQGWCKGDKGTSFERSRSQFCRFYTEMEF